MDIMTRFIGAHAPFFSISLQIVVAAAVVGVECAGITLPVKVSTSAGFELAIDGDWRTGKCTGMTLTGPARRVFDGVIDLDAMADEQALE